MANYISPLPATAWKNTPQRFLSILGSTGSIGTATLDVVRASDGNLTIIALAAGSNIMLLARQASEFRPPYLVIKEQEHIAVLRTMLPTGYHPTILSGQEGYETVAALAEVSLVVSAQSGAAGLRGTFAAVAAGKIVALANKESLVLAGTQLKECCSESGASILPIDSEHNAIFQCLAGSRLQDIRKLILTASGGPFYGKNISELVEVTPFEALNHPNWHMGPKITIDSATMMNKGLEVIEAHHLFGVALHSIDVVIHRQSIIHSMVEFNDGTILAQLGSPDMRAAISYCLNWPRRVACGVQPLDLRTLNSLTFEDADTVNFPALELAKKAQNLGNGCPVALNAANEVAVAAFLDGQLGFTEIATVVEQVCVQHMVTESDNTFDTIGPILVLDSRSRWHAENLIRSGHC